MNYCKPSSVGIALIAFTAVAGAKTTQQSTTLRAPVAAIAIGPSHASVDINVNRGGSHTVVVRKPLIAVSTPFRSMHIRAN